MLFGCAVGWLGWDNDVIGVAFSFTSAHTSWDAAARSHALAIIHHATLLCILEHLRTYVILVSCAVGWGGEGWDNNVIGFAFSGIAAQIVGFAQQCSIPTYIYIYILIFDISYFKLILIGRDASSCYF